VGTYAYNRSGFNSSAAHQLKSTYCSLVAIELALKESLGKINTTGNRGHDVPGLLQEYAAMKPDAGTILALSTQLGTALAALWSQGIRGTEQKVPSNSYPYLRYLRHDSGGWGGSHSTDAELSNLANVVSTAQTLLRTKGVM